MTADRTHTHAHTASFLLLSFPAFFSIFCCFLFWSQGDEYSHLDCSSDRSFDCLEEKYEKFDHVNDGHKTFEEACLICVEDDYTHYTIIFNAFVFCQIFNEFNARSITDDWNVFTGLSTNPVFVGVIIFTVVLQVFLVQFTGVFTKTSPLSASQWLITTAMGFISIPVGIIMRWIPVEEDPENFASMPDDS
jgi:magnesium-transporting ATPase (P-type)